MQNTKLIKKISTSLVSTGEIIDSLQSNSSTSAPSIRAVVDNMTPPMNLLINGDFQINQRGQTTYYANGTNWLYTVDMWRINNHSKLYVNDGYIRFHKVDSDQQALLNQVVKTEGKSITLIKVKKINGTATVRFGDSTVTKTITQSGIFTIENDTPISSIAIDLVTNGHYIDIEYIDLWEGDIAYPHIPEDDAIALLRCQKKLKSFGAGIIATGICSTASRFIATILVDMDELPTLTATVNKLSVIVRGTAKTPTSATLASASTKQVVALVLEFSGNPFTAGNSGYAQVLDGSLELSCEPL